MKAKRINTIFTHEQVIYIENRWSKVYSLNRLGVEALRRLGGLGVETLRH